MVAGLVASAACCAIVPTWAGIIAGAVAATFAQALATVAPMVGIDDPVNAGAVTGTCHTYCPVRCVTTLQVPIGPSISRYRDMDIHNRIIMTIACMLL